MTQPTPKDIVRRFNTDVIQKADRAAFEAIMAPDYVNRTAPPGSPNDLESIWQTFMGLHSAFSDLTVHIHDMFAEGNVVTTRKTITGTHTGKLMDIEPKGGALSVDIIDIVRVADGRYAEHWGVTTLPQALAALREGAAA
ncbi:ester cyclase [Novosphingobium sp. 9]|uniref:ester cyclase n=1 Tax=Novosphingobium sp. 9 TaxID=2025349 RepID=UPI0021B505AD|nr:ester cyclase [Novosphingobium sp. 9]